MKRAVIIHCWAGYPEYCWYPQTRKELEAIGFQVAVPAMPHTELPTLVDWLPVLEQAVGTPDQDVWLIGHSIGAVTVLRYLETLPEGARVAGVILVAGFIDPLGFRELENFFDTRFDFSKIKQKSARLTLIHSDNDPFVPIQYGHRLAEELGGELIVKAGMGHFSGAVDGEDSCLSLPEVSSAITASHVLA